MAGYSIPGQVEEAQVLAACRQRDAATLELLYRAYAQPLREFCERQLGNRHDAEDAVQDTMLRAARSSHALAPNSRVWSWLATIAVHVCADIRTSAARVDYGVEPRDVPGPELEDEVARRIRAGIVAEAVDELPERLRTPLVLRDFMDWTYEDIAGFSDRSIPGVKSALMRARRTLATRVTAVARRRGQWPLPVGVAVAPRRVRAFVRRLRTWGWTEAGRSDAAGYLLTGGQLVASALAALSCLGVSPPLVSWDRVSLVAAVGGAEAPASSADGRATGTSGTDAKLGDASRTSTVASSPATPGPAVPLPLGPTDSPDRTRFDDFTASPDYQHDGTVFATGVGCSDGTGCEALFKSSDRGATWTRLPAVGLTAAHVLLPPAYPRDRRIFAGGGDLFSPSFQISVDDGMTFQTIGTAVSTPVMSPAFSSGDPRIFIPDAPGWQYDDRLKSVVPLLLDAPTTASTSRTLAIGPASAADDAMFLGGVANGSASSTAYVCRRGVCEQSTVPFGGTGAPDFVVGEGDNRGLVFGWTWRWFASSDDGGRHFGEVPLPIGLGSPSVEAVTTDAAGRVYLLLRGFDSGYRTRLYRLADHGGTWTELLGARSWVDDVPGVHRFPNRGFSTITVLPDGKILGALDEAGLVCSADDGGTFLSRCGGSFSGGPDQCVTVALTTSCH